jgi:NAD(P)-dependent dehydrogenase (short-subunit alcohol dehydrogenase family)
VSVKDLAGKRAWVTGGGKGIGRSIAHALAARGARVLVTGRDEAALAAVVGEIACAAGSARHLVCDVRDPDALEAAAAHAVSLFGGLDVVVANAGISGRTPVGEARERARDIVETNLLGAYYTFAAALPRMSGPGRLLAVSSVLAKFGVPGYAAYCASKAGVLGLVRALAHEAAPKRITVNAIVPGWVDTDMADEGLAEIGRATGQTPAEVKADAVKAFPLGRFVEPGEVGALAAFLAGPSGDAITGQALSICGGATAFGG